MDMPTNSTTRRMMSLISAVMNAAAAKLQRVDKLQRVATPEQGSPDNLQVQWLGEHTNPAKNRNRAARRQAKAAKVSASQQLSPANQRKALGRKAVKVLRSYART